LAEETRWLLLQLPLPAARRPICPATRDEQTSVRGNTGRPDRQRARRYGYAPHPFSFHRAPLLNRRLIRLLLGLFLVARATTKNGH
jgi:hypothetical protein